MSRLLASFISALAALPALAQLPESPHGPGQPQQPQGPGHAQTQAPAEAVGTIPDPAYRIAVGDHIGINIYQESQMSASQRVDVDGKLRLPLVGEVQLAGMSVREAERALEEIYRERELLRAPLVTIVVVGYALRELSILGAVRNPGNFQFPREVTSLEIADLITRVGGFLPTAKGNNVYVIRRTPDGKENVLTVNVESMISGRRRGDGATSFPVYPGDRIWVEERMF